MPRMSKSKAKKVYSICNKATGGKKKNPAKMESCVYKVAKKTKGK